MPLLLFTSRQDHVVDPGQSEHLAAHVRRRGRPSLARTQLPRRHPGLRPARHHRRRGRVRPVHTAVGQDRRGSACAGLGGARVTMLASIPSPGEQLDRHRAALAQRLRADDRPRRRRRGVAVRPAPRGSGRWRPARSPARSPCGPCSPASSAPGCTTSSPTGSASTATSATSRRSGRAASASPAG